METQIEATTLRYNLPPAALAALGAIVGFIGIFLFLSDVPFGPLMGYIAFPVAAMMIITATIRGALHGWFQGRR